jgi:DNA ligase (NAD+)
MSQAKPNNKLKSTKGGSNLDAKPVAELDETDAAAELARLAADITHRDELYYRVDESEISDAAYDALRVRNDKIEARFPHLIREDSPSLRVGAPPVGAFGKVPHRVPMLSIDNAFTEDKVDAFLVSAKAFLGLAPEQPLEVTAEPKIDGLSITLRYERGRLIQGATRGDGYEGEDVTANVRTIGDIPKTVPAKDFPRFEVRGDLHAPCRFSAPNAEQAGMGSRSSPTRVMPPPASSSSSHRLPPSGPALFAYGWGDAELAGRYSMGLYQALGLRLPSQSADALTSSIAEMLETIVNRRAPRRTWLRHRRRGLQNQPRVDLQERLGFPHAAMGARSQISGGEGDHNLARHRYPGQAHRRATLPLIPSPSAASWSRTQRCITRTRLRAQMSASAIP